MRKLAHRLDPTEEALLIADINLRRTLTTKSLMRRYNASRSLVDKYVRMTRPPEDVPHETKQDASHSRQHADVRIELGTLATGPSP